MRCDLTTQLSWIICRLLPTIGQGNNLSWKRRLARTSGRLTIRRQSINQSVSHPCAEKDGSSNQKNALCGLRIQAFVRLAPVASQVHACVKGACGHCSGILPAGWKITWEEKGELSKGFVDVVAYCDGGTREIAAIVEVVCGVDRMFIKRLTTALHWRSALYI